MEVVGDSSAPFPGPPLFRSKGETSCRQVRGWNWQQASRSRRRSKEAGCGKHLGRQHHQLLGQSYRQAGKMAYAIYTAEVKNCCTACTAVHVSRTVLLNSTIQSITVRWFLFLYQVYSTTVVLPVLGVLSFFCFRCSCKTAVVLYSSTECFFRLNLISSSIYFVLNFELVVIYRGLLHCCTLVYTYLQQYVQQY